jgi:antitoxin (DNA-binding transcriptional repressor) of toxin-antitoxin stability system
VSKTVGAAEFKAHCLRIMEEASRSGETVVITKRGKPFMELKRVVPETRALLFGCMKDKMTVLGDLDEPVYDKPWNAELGILD